MTNKWTIALLCLGALGTAAEEARADVVSDRVLLMTGGTGCTNATSFRRVVQGPDGASTVESTEFQVPAGKYLEITSIEYTTPYWTPWARSYRQSLSLGIRQRNGTASNSVFTAWYQNQAVYAADGDNLDVTGEQVAPGARTNVVAFPVGPLMSSAGRLCALASSNFWLFQGEVRVRGRLIPTGDILIDPVDGNRLP